MAALNGFTAGILVGVVGAFALSTAAVTLIVYSGMVRRLTSHRRSSMASK